VSSPLAKSASEPWSKEAWKVREFNQAGFGLLEGLQAGRLRATNRIREGLRVNMT
jgi:hypothetical protein